MLTLWKSAAPIDSPVMGNLTSMDYSCHQRARCRKGCRALVSGPDDSTPSWVHPEGLGFLFPAGAWCSVWVHTGPCVAMTSLPASETWAVVHREGFSTIKVWSGLISLEPGIPRL